MAQSSGRLKSPPSRLFAQPLVQAQIKETSMLRVTGFCCQLSSAATGMSLELHFLTQFQWREAYVLDSWQLAELPQSGGREFDPRRVHDNLSVPLWVYMRFPVPEHQN